MYIFIYKFYFEFKLFFTHMHINIYFLLINILRVFFQIEKFLNLQIHIKLMTFKK